LEIEHIVGKTRGGTDDENNLWLACRLCNNYKGIQDDGLDSETGQIVRLFNPRHQKWSDHFSWSADGTRVLGQTPCGRATVLSLQMNNLISIMVRREWVAAGWHPPSDDN
jgi:hypothetical protein